MICVHNSLIFTEEVKMSSSNNDNHVSPNEGNNWEMETNNEDEYDIDEEEDENLETDTSAEVDHEVWFEFWQDVIFFWVSAGMVIARNVSAGV